MIALVLLAALLGVAICRPDRVPARAAFWFPALWLTLSVTWKAGLTVPLVCDFHNHPNGMPWWLPYWGTLNLILLGALFSLAPRRVYAVFCLTANLLFSLLFLADRLHYRSFGDLVTLFQWDQLRFVDRISASVTSFVRPIDLWLFLDLPLAAWAIWRLRRHPLPDRMLRRAVQVAVLILAIAGNVLGGMTLKTAMASYLLRKRFKNMGVVYLMGLVNYHLYDVREVVEDTWLRHLVPPPPLEPLKALTQAARESIEEPTDKRGVAAGKNLLILQVESLQSFVIDLEVNGQEVTPFLNRFRKSGLYSDLFFDQTHTGVSSDCDFTLLNSMYPAPSRPACFEYASANFRALPSLLRAQGYTTFYAHPYDATFYNYFYLSGRYGYDTRLFQKQLRPRRGEMVGWGLSDRALLERVGPMIEELPQPFMAHVVSVMGHHPFAELQRSQHLLDLPAHLANSVMGNYLQMCRYRDAQLEWFFDDFLRGPRSADTVVVFLGDHATVFGLHDINRVVPPRGRPAAFSDAMRLRVPFFVYVPGGPHGRIPGPTGHVDVAPTLMHLLGAQDPGAVFLGRNMFSRKSAPLAVCPRTRVAVDENHLLLLERDEAFSLTTGATAEAPELRQRAVERLDASHAIMRYDLIPALSGP